MSGPVCLYKCHWQLWWHVRVLNSYPISDGEIYTLCNCVLRGMEELQNNWKLECVHILSSIWFPPAHLCLLPYSRGGKHLAFGAHGQHNYWSNNYNQICIDRKWGGLPYEVFGKVHIFKKVDGKCSIKKLPLVFITKWFYKSIEVRRVTNNINAHVHCCIFRKTPGGSNSMNKKEGREIILQGLF